MAIINPVPSEKRYIVVLRLAQTSVPNKIANARSYVQKMTGNANFPEPIPPLENISSQASQLEATWNAARGGGKAATQAMYLDERKLVALLIHLGHYVEDIANVASNPAEVISSAGMEYKITPVHTARTFRVRNGSLKGSVEASTKSADKRASYIWQYRVKASPDWLAGATTIKATFSFEGLTSGTTYEFRVKVVTKDGEGDWSDVLELLVL